MFLSFKQSFCDRCHIQGKARVQHTPARSLTQQQERVMADRNIWEKAESVSRIFAAVLIPVILGFAGLFANQALETSKVKDDLLKQAIDVVFLSNSDKMSGNIKSFESRRAHRSH